MAYTFSRNMNSEIAAELEAFDPEIGDAGEFDRLLASCFEALTPQEAARLLVRILEDHPEEDGTPYWGIVHGLEAVGSYEAILHESLIRRPSFFGALLANRMLNAGEGLDWIPNTFDLILASASTPPRVRQMVTKFVARIPKTNGEQDAELKLQE
jgi:hypothetical protein